MFENFIAQNAAYSMLVGWFIQFIRLEAISHYVGERERGRGKQSTRRNPRSPSMWTGVTYVECLEMRSEPLSRLLQK